MPSRLDLPSLVSPPAPGRCSGLRTALRAAGAALLLVAGLSGTAAARDATSFAECLGHFPGRTPPTGAALAQVGLPRALCFDAFAVLHSGERKTPVYVVEKLTPEQLQDASDEERTNRFYPEARLPHRERAQLEDYRGSGFDRGHMAAARQMPTAQAMAQSFSLANVVPQAPVVNRKIWAKIESDTRKYVRRAIGPVYVFTGPVYSNPVPKTIGAGRVHVPDHIFKLVYDARTGRAWAHWMDNTDDARIARPLSYEELVRRTGIQFIAVAPH